MEPLWDEWCRVSHCPTNWWAFLFSLLIYWRYFWRMDSCKELKCGPHIPANLKHRLLKFCLIIKLFVICKTCKTNANRLHLPCEHKLAADLLFGCECKEAMERRSAPLSWSWLTKKERLKTSHSPSLTVTSYGIIFFSGFLKHYNEILFYAWRRDLVLYSRIFLDVSAHCH